MPVVHAESQIVNEKLWPYDTLSYLWTFIHKHESTDLPSMEIFGLFQ